MLSRHRRGSTCAVAGLAVILLVSGALAAKPSPTLPAQIPTSERARLQELADTPGIAGAHVMAPMNFAEIPVVIEDSGVTRKKRRK